MTIEQLGALAKGACPQLYLTSEEKINQTLIAVADSVVRQKEFIKEQNILDIEKAKSKGMADAFIDRLTLTDKVIEGMAEGIKQVANLTSPIGKSVYQYENVEQGIKIDKVAVPFGVIGIIYESRPNVTADAFALCFKTKNAVILKGGSDGIYSNKALVKIIKEVLKENGINENAVSLIEDSSRENTVRFMKMREHLDLLIPRGGANLIRSVVENATVPIIETGTGNCHIYVDKFANIDMAKEVIFNAKTQRYSVCNACESLVIHNKILSTSLPVIANKLKEKQVEIRADERAFEAISDYPYLKRATEEDFATEYTAGIISVKTVDSIDEAILHINANSTSHSESIITDSEERAKKFTDLIDSSSVYHNASTRFSDGFVFGLGAEIGISTQKLHARGPMGLDALVTTKYIIKGNGAVRK